MDQLDYAAAIQIAILQEELLFQIRGGSREKYKVQRPKQFWIITRLTNEGKVQFGHYDKLMLELRVEDTNITSFFN